MSLKRCQRRAIRLGVANSPEVFVGLVTVSSIAGESSSRDLISTGDQNLTIQVQRGSRHSVGVIPSDYAVTSRGYGMADIVTVPLSGLPPHLQGAHCHSCQP